MQADSATARDRAVLAAFSAAYRKGSGTKWLAASVRVTIAAAEKSRRARVRPEEPKGPETEETYRFAVWIRWVRLTFPGLASVTGAASDSTLNQCRQCEAALYRGIKVMAERVGFEPTIPVKVCPLSRRPVIRI